MPGNQNNPSQRMAQQAQGRFHRHAQQAADRQMKGLVDQWRTAHIVRSAQEQYRQRQQEPDARQNRLVPAS